MPFMSNSTLALTFPLKKLLVLFLSLRLEFIRKTKQLKYEESTILLFYQKSLSFSELKYQNNAEEKKKEKGINTKPMW